MLIWKIKWDDRARKELRKLDKSIQNDILKYFRKKINSNEDPCRFGKSLRYDRFGLWRYRVRDYRIICRIYDEELIVLVLRIGHRKEVYL